MKKILFLALVTSYTLFANGLPNSTKSTIVKVTGNTIQLSNNIPVGVSGIIIHNYGNGLSAITHSAISLGNSQARIEPNRAIVHKNIPSIQTAVKTSDKIIFGSFYNNALVIAPDARSYKQITNKFKRTWIHPDTLALHLIKEDESSLNMQVLKEFALKNQIGLILVATKNEIRIIDPVSQEIIGNTHITMNVAKPITPFFARFEQMDISMFGFSDKKFPPYFELVAGLR